MRLSWGRIVFGALLIVLGVAWLLETSGLVDIPLRALTPIALIVIGIGLVAGARRGSQTALIVVGAVLTLVLATDSTGARRFENRDFGDRVGDTAERPRTASDLHPYRLDAGTLEIDLTRLELKKRTYEVNARVRAGRIHVVVPAGVPLKVNARSGVGSLQVIGNRRSGVSSRVSTVSGNYESKRPRIALTLRVSVGSIRVERADRERSADGSI